MGSDPLSTQATPATPEIPQEPFRDRTEAALKRFIAAGLRVLLSPGGDSFNPAHIRHILIVRQHDQLGDMICVVPMLRALKHRYPEASLTLVASPVNYAVMLHNPYLDRVLNYNKANIRKSPQAGMKFLSELRAVPYDIAIVPATVSLSLTSDIIAVLSGARVRVGPRTLNGITNPAASSYTHAVDLNWSKRPDRHQALRNFDILAPLGIRTEPPVECTLGISPEEHSRAEAELLPMKAKHAILVGLHPGAGKRGNRWPAERFARLAGHLAERYNAGIIVTAGPMDAEPMAEFTAAATSDYYLVQNRPIREVAAILNCLELVISNDTGIMHIAGGLRPAVISLFGPTDPRQWAPSGAKKRCIAAKDGDITSIAEDTVYDAVRELIEQMTPETR